MSTPNIIFITLDQMRFPMHFPKDLPEIENADQFIEKFMPNLYNRLWKGGVKFSNHYTAASDCTAARATIYTGLYAYQTYSMLTLTNYWLHDITHDHPPPLGPRQPDLQPEFPTIGSILRDVANYDIIDTPYFGKWHLSYDASNLENYGFKSYTPFEDYPGFQGQGLRDDHGIATDAVGWLQQRVSSNNQNPFFLSVNFINPHDKQWFWGGMQATNYNGVYANIPVPPSTTTPPSEQPPQDYTHNIEFEDNPPSSYPYSGDITGQIPNWEDQDELNSKPGAQSVLKEVFQYQMGGVYEADEASSQNYTQVNSPAGFYYANTPLHAGKHKAIAPYDYWTLALNSYIQIMKILDDEIEAFLKDIPPQIWQNTVFILTSDHGEYGSSHGLQGKGGTVYEEGIRVPLVVYDKSGNFTKATGETRNQLTSSVDLLPMIVTMGFGSSDWMKKGVYQQLYGNRCPLLPILQSPSAEGRTYALHTTDEFVPNSANWLQAPMHIIGVIQTDPQGNNKQKLGVYTTWEPYSESPDHAVVNEDNPQLEFYDFSTTGGANETDNTYTSAAAQALLAELWNNLLPNELQASVGPYQEFQTSAYRQLQDYMKLVNEESDSQSTGDVLGVAHQQLARVWAL